MLDRDGIIIEDAHYLHRPEDVHFIPGAPEAVAKINKLGFSVVLVTNQAGIGRGYYGWEDFELVQDRIEHELQLVDGLFLRFSLTWIFVPSSAKQERSRQFRVLANI